MELQKDNDHSAMSWQSHYSTNQAFYANLVKRSIEAAEEAEAAARIKRKAKRQKKKAKAAADALEEAERAAEEAANAMDADDVPLVHRVKRLVGTTSELIMEDGEDEETFTTADDRRLVLALVQSTVEGRQPSYAYAMLAKKVSPFTLFPSMSQTAHCFHDQTPRHSADDWERYHGEHQARVSTETLKELSKKQGVKDKVVIGLRNEVERAQAGSVK